MGIQKETDACKDHPLWREHITEKAVHKLTTRIKDHIHRAEQSNARFRKRSAQKQLGRSNTEYMTQIIIHHVCADAHNTDPNGNPLFSITFS